MVNSMRLRKGGAGEGALLSNNWKKKTHEALSVPS